MCGRSTLKTRPEVLSWPSTSSSLRGPASGHAITLPKQIATAPLRSELFDPRIYFDRAEALFLRPGFDVDYAKARPAYWRHRLRKVHRRPGLTLFSPLQVAGIGPDRLGGGGLGIHSPRKTAINDAIRNGATMHVGQPYCLLQQPCPGFFLVRSADDTSAHASFSTSLHLEQVAADLEIRRILSTAGKPRGRGKLERFFESLAQVCLCRLLTPIARVLTINNLLRVTPAVVEVARDSLVIGTA